ncbi:MAG: tetratricopeptide repeat protein [Rhodothermales bacterium]|nr:tetratricopeptide repeat protein [Rhodothermales bacterium]
MPLPPPLRALGTRFRGRQPLLLLVGGFLLFAGLLYARINEQPGYEWEPLPSAAAPAAPSAAPAPSAANVDPSFHGQIMALKAQVAQRPDDADALRQLAGLLHDAHQLDEAAAHYARYLALAPNDRQAWLDLANAYGALEAWDDAEAASRRMLERFPNDPSALYNLGAITANAGRYDEARTWWERVRDQQADAALAAQAEGSLRQLAALEARPPSDADASAAPAAVTSAGGAAPPLRPDQRTLPEGHPPIASAGRSAPASRFVAARPVPGTRE